MARDLSILKKNVNQLYPDIQYDNANTLHILRNGTKEEIEQHFTEMKENEVYRSPYFSYAMEKLNLIGTRFYIDEVDITSAMREVIYKNGYKNDDELWKVYLKAIEKQENDCFEDYLRCLIGETPKEYTGFTTYIQLAKEVNNYSGVLNSENPYEDNPREFRKLVKRLINARKKCMQVVTFTVSNISEKNEHLVNEDLSYEDALMIAEDIIDHIETFGYPKGSLKVDKHDDIIEAMDALYSSDNTEKLKSSVMEKFITNFIGQTGQDRRLYSKYTDSPLYHPYKKLALTIGLFSEPYINLEDQDDIEPAIADNLERFMNQHSYSIKSYFATVTEFDVMTDEDFLNLVRYGLSLDLLAYMLKHYAKTERNLPKK